MGQLAPFFWREGAPSLKLNLIVVQAELQMMQRSSFTIILQIPVHTA
jgi:hypothetical protein